MILLITASAILNTTLAVVSLIVVSVGNVTVLSDVTISLLVLDVIRSVACTGNVAVVRYSTSLLNAPTLVGTVGYAGSVEVVR